MGQPLRLTLLLALVANSLSLAAQAPVWEATGTKECLQFSLAETARLARTQEPVVLAGAEVLNRTSLRPIAVRTMRLFGPEGELPVQVDERDGGDTWVAEGNGALDPTDEIVFLANLVPNSTASYRLYYGGPDLGAAREFPLALRVGLVPTDQFSQLRCDAVLENSRLGIGVRSTPSADPRRLELGKGNNEREGTITTLRVNGVEMVDTYVPLLWTHFQHYEAPWDGLRVVGGQVRLTAVAHKRLTGTYRHGVGEWAVTWNDHAQVEGDLYRSFTIYADSPLIDVRDEIVAREVGDDFTMNYRFAVRPPVSEGERWENTRTVYLPDGEGAKAVRHGGDRVQVNAGWLGVADTKTGLGLALYYDPSTAYQATWDLFYPWEPHWTPGTPEWEKAEAFFHLGTYNREVLAHNRGAMAFRLLVLSGQNPEEAILNQRWANARPLRETIAWAPVWKPGTAAPEVVTPADQTRETLTAVGKTLGEVRRRLGRFPQLMDEATGARLAEFEAEIAQTRALPDLDPASRRDRLDRTSALGRRLAEWTASLPVRRLELFEKDSRAAARGFAGYVEDTLVKVFPEGPVATEPQTQAVVELARDEYEGFQVVLVPGAQEITDLKVEVSDLTGPGGARIPATEIRRYRVGYVSRAQGGVAEEAGYWPDPLIPLPGCPDLPAESLFPPEQMSLGVLQPSRLAPFWFTIHAPRDAAPGMYTGRVTFRGPGGALEVPVSVRVFGFTIPQQWSLRGDTWFNLGEGFYNYYGSWCDAEELAPIVRFMDTYRVTSQLSWLQMDAYLAAAVEEDGSYTFDFSRLKPFYEICLARGNWFSANLSCYPGWGGLFAGVFGRRTKVLDKRTGETLLLPKETLSQEAVMETELWKAFWPAYEAWLRENGWLDKCYLENCDEPPYGNPDAPECKFLRKFHTTLRQLAPGLRLFNYGVDPAPWMHGWAEPYTDWWGPHLSRAEETKAYLAEQVKRGKPFVGYVCGGGRRTLDHHTPDVDIDRPALDLRVLPWMIYKYGGSGLLCYAGNSWAGGETLKYVETDPQKRWPARPWHLATTFGTGWLTYPAPRMKAVYPSIRLEALRDGLEDYEYLAALQKHEAGSALLQLEPVVKNVLIWSEDPRDLRARRAALGRALE